MKIFGMSTPQRYRPVERYRLGRVTVVVGTTDEFAVAPCSNARKLDFLSVMFGYVLETSLTGRRLSVQVLDGTELL